VPLSNFVPRGFGFVQHSIAILYHEVPNPNFTIRNFFIAVVREPTHWVSAPAELLAPAHSGARTERTAGGWSLERRLVSQLVVQSVGVRGWDAARRSFLTAPSRGKNEGIYTLYTPLAFRATKNSPMCTAELLRRSRVRTPPNGCGSASRRRRILSERSCKQEFGISFPSPGDGGGLRHRAYHAGKSSAASAGTPGDTSAENGGVGHTLAPALVEPTAVAVANLALGTAVQATLTWLDMLWLDTKGRLAAVRRSQRRVQRSLQTWHERGAGASRLALSLALSALARYPLFDSSPPLSRSLCARSLSSL
jgi:hypothetical protein